MILFSKIKISSSKQANGIEVKRFDQKLNFNARKEVILSAGAVSSPHILLLSGIGPKEQLELVELPLIHELPGVGENLQDHVMTSIWLNSVNSENQVGAN